MRKLRILTLCYEYPPLGGGGGRVAAQVSEGLASRGHEVRILTSGMKHLPEREKIGNVIIDRVPCFRRREDTCSVPEMAFFLASAFPRALRLVRKWRPDVMHVHFAVPTGALALPIHWLTKTPYVLTAHLGDVPGGVPEQTGNLFKFLGPFIAPIWNNAAGATAVSSFVAGLARASYGREVRVILNGIPASPAPASFTPHDPVRLLFVGRLSVQKNPLSLLGMAREIRDLPWKLDVIGEGPLSGSLRSAVNSASLQDRITLHGWKSASDVRKIMLDSDILLMPSHSEGLPMAAIEALHCGLAIVGADIPGLHDVVLPDRNGALCPMATLDAEMASAVRMLIQHPETLSAWKRASRERAAHFDLAKSVEAYEEILAANSQDSDS